MKLLLIDNYDSFTYNLVHYFEAILQDKVTVLRNDDAQLRNLDCFDVLVFSPGPGLPDEAGKMKAIIKAHYRQKPMLGICLGMQAIAECFGAQLSNLSTVVHGRASWAKTLDSSCQLFAGVPSPFLAGRYHSWVVNKETLPDELQLTSITETGEIMSIRHKKYPILGVQFHPESVLTPNGYQMLENFIEHFCKE